MTDEDKINILNFSLAEHCRKFLTRLKFKGQIVTGFGLEDGRQLSAEEMTDDEVISYANKMYLDFCKGVEGGTLTADDDGYFDLAVELTKIALN